MKKLSILVATLLMGAFSLQAQTADGIINNYQDVTGGAEAWSKVNGISMKASVNQGGMEIPVEVIRLRNGKQMIAINLQGKEIVQVAFDGEDLWSTNFQTMKPEKADGEMKAIVMDQINDFPDPLTDYKKKGYTAELVGTETMDGVETQKIKLTKNPLTIEGKEVENIDYYYFDKDSGVLIAHESEQKVGPQKGSVEQTFYSDYQEVNGLYFPFSMNRGIKGGGSQPIQFSEIVVNPEIDESRFSFPEEVEVIDTEE